MTDQDVVLIEKRDRPPRSPGEQVLADSNLVWQITNALQAAPSIWDFHKWYSLSTVNKAFQCALAGQPVALKLERQIIEHEESLLKNTKLHIVQLELHPQDERVASILLSPAFRWISLGMITPLSILQ